MLSKNRRASSYIAVRICAVICGNIAGSKTWRFKPPTPNHCAPKPSNSARERAILQQTQYLRIQNGRLMERSIVCQRHQLDRQAW